MAHALSDFLVNGEHGICSICSAHPWVIEAALRFDLKSERIVLIEATSNQVNQNGGYTGMLPADFREFVHAIAHKVGFPVERIWLGGDHLGPNPWRDKPAEEAMGLAEEMVTVYAQAGFTKLHLDASMPLGGDSIPLPADVVAQRASRLCRAAELATQDRKNKPVYIIGTEVPVPGGETEGLDGIEITRPARLKETIDTHRAAFSKDGLEHAMERVIAVVVQPGVDFSDSEVMEYDPSQAQALLASLNDYPGFVFEAHSSDYQPASAYRALVNDHFSILKVGPALTFALREGLFALAAIEQELIPANKRSNLREVIEGQMLEQPDNWRSYYQGDEERLAYLRAYSYSDRIRYYWNNAAIQQSVECLINNLSGVKIPVPLLTQYLGKEFSRMGEATDPVHYLLDKVYQVLESYQFGCQAR
ncbi:D-tagatose-bisphosphate aldolase, class II, non-catalytic subunit [Carnimonas nigrificans]|uniref:D-tagatose-bisphosphate aldolase, class II, non-catalytic subunit n=1 Tax=Carnimonas nigrificans TaxID=64323 RepID=UPI00046EFA69|nr:D-tagatose-bisphosphate aldolase, class II, non-catalytic subunit [Carnimonas nigrificans]